MNTSRATAVWQRGPVEGFAPVLQPAVHALLDVAEEIGEQAPFVTYDQLWARPAGVASIGFHLLHLVGSTDRLLTYARDEALTDAQRVALKAELVELDRDTTASALVERTQVAIRAAVAGLRNVDPATLFEIRYIGRARIPSTVHGLIFHAAEHASRHAGQLTTTLKIVTASTSEPVA